MVSAAPNYRFTEKYSLWFTSQPLKCLMVHYNQKKIATLPCEKVLRGIENIVL